jgi:adenylate cyclase
MERTLVALWFADIAGYSEHAARDESSALRLVEILQDTASEIVPQFRGNIAKFVGDAVLAQFPSAELAVRAAITLSHGYVQRCDAIGHAEHLRIGVHLADVAIAADGDLYGDGVNTAARIQEAAEPGQVVISQDVWRQLRGRREFRFQHLGDRSLKGIGNMDIYVATVGDSSVSNPTVTENVRSQTPRSPIRSLAVLPLVDLSAERDQEHFGDGVAEEILNALTKLDDLRVPARSSCFAFRGLNLDAREVGRRLAVEALLEGSVRKVGKRLRINVQLIDARNGYHLWSERFDREVADVFAIQDEIASSVVRALGVSTGKCEQRHFVKASTANVEAYEFYLRGRKLFQKWTRENINLAREMFERAVTLDPQFAAAWAGIATAHVHLHGCDSEPHLEKAREASVRALKLDPQSAEAHVAAAQGLSMEQRYAEAAAKFERAIELDPNLFDAHYYYGRSCFKSGDLEKSLRLFRQAQSVRPEDYQAVYLEALVLMQLRGLNDARDAYQRGLESSQKHLAVNPHDARAYVLGAGAFARLGEIERAREWAERAMWMAPDDDAILYNAGCALAVVGEEERALDALQRAIHAGLSGGDWIPQDPDWERLRNHPRFQILVEQLRRS